MSVVMPPTINATPTGVIHVVTGVVTNGALSAKRPFCRPLRTGTGKSAPDPGYDLSGVNAAWRAGMRGRAEDGAS
ncbi:hypothetical protein Ani05nite_36360 [Amorphoplanes nipponensis]|uniref:Uncharacterized protein n=1 Tax=Actinoplanes nipponensis TaxID=135950 RepID=A0A919JII8_9ACTN|nr:hypothetical protein Ani05nite_36360 [Actinoplanes nipponensis]